jgi:methylmalonyl-CoA/ethylmalonyl-CoA epimerase
MIFDHVGLFVRDLAEGRRHLGNLLPIRSWTEAVEDPVIKVRVCFGVDAGGVRYELVAPFGDPNPVSQSLDAGKNLLNHVAYRTREFAAATERLRGAGAMPLGRPLPAAAFGGARVVFYLTPLRFVIELIEDRS